MTPPEDLRAAALAAQRSAYAPYSGFKVGAALRAASGRIHAAANVENAAYPQSQCAEASAIGVMIAFGDTKIVEALVIGGSDNPCPPCGGCCQRLAEFAAADVPVHMLGAADGAALTRSLGELLPHGFALRVPAPPADAVATIRARYAGPQPVLGILLGSGLGAVAETLERPTTIAYAELPGFPRPTVAGHGGRLILGQLAGVPVLCLQGRAHLYEGHPANAILPMVRSLRSLGCRILIITNAAGSLRSEYWPGSIVLIKDHINLMATNPLIGSNDEAVGPRFPDLTAVYEPSLRAVAGRGAAAIGLPLSEGVYVAVPGPSFETPAEIHAYRRLGGDLVGMSTVPEAIAARHCGLRVVGLSVVTNLAAGLAPGPLSHEETLAGSAAAVNRLRDLLLATVKDLADAGRP